MVKIKRQEVFWPKYYGGLKLQVFAPKYYYSVERRKDPYSKQVVDSKTRDLSDSFFVEISAGFSELPFKPDVIVVVPASHVGDFSPTLLELGRKLSVGLGIPDENVLFRKVFRRKMTNCRNSQERFEAVNGTLELQRRVDGKKIVLLDDTRGSGMSLLESAKVLNAGGAAKVVAVCLGINGPRDDDDKS